MEADEAAGCEAGDVVVVVREQARSRVPELSELNNPFSKVENNKSKSWVGISCDIENNIQIHNDTAQCFLRQDETSWAMSHL